MQELASALQSAHPKIQKMCEEESDDAEAVAKLLEINDSIHRTIERYKLVKKGDLEAASMIPKGTLGTSTGVTKTADNELSLIDFSGDAQPSAITTDDGGGTTGQKSASIEDDLLGLSLQNQSYGQTGGIALGMSGNSGVLSLASMFLNTALIRIHRCSQILATSSSYSRNVLQTSNVSACPLSTASARTTKAELRPFLFTYV